MRQLTFLIFFVLSAAMTGHADEGKWQEHKTTHFYIYYKTAPLDFVENVAQAAEGYYAEITRNLGFTRYENWSYEKRASIYIYRDQDDYVISAKTAGWSHGVANAKDKVIRTFPSAHGFFDSTLPHEMGHIIFREFVGFRSALPLWLDEGVAMYQEKAKRWGANDSVFQAIKTKTFIPLPELSVMSLTSETDSKVVNLFYAEAASIVYYLISELGQYRFVAFCQKLKDGETFEKALTDTYPRFTDLEGLNRTWTKYLEEQSTKE